MKGCWLCVGEDPDCGCCRYIEQQCPAKVPLLITSTYNTRASLNETSRLTKLSYLTSSLSCTISNNDKPLEAMTPLKMFMERPKKRARVAGSKDPVALKRLTRFLKVVDILNRLPGRDVWFDENQRVLRILIATHLKVIVGMKEFKANHLQLYRLIDDEDFSMINYLIWTASRQQGKTTLFAL